MGLGLRRWICGRGWGRAPAPPSSAEGERCGCPGPSVQPRAGGQFVERGMDPGLRGPGGSGGLERGTEAGAGEDRGASEL